MVSNNKNLLIGGQQTLYKYKNVQDDRLHIKTLIDTRKFVGYL